MWSFFTYFIGIPLQDVHVYWLNLFLFPDVLVGGLFVIRMLSDFSVTIPRWYKDVHVNSFSPPTAVSLCLENGFFWLVISVALSPLLIRAFQLWALFNQFSYMLFFFVFLFLFSFFFLHVLQWLFNLKWSECWLKQKGLIQVVVMLYLIKVATLLLATAVAVNGFSAESFYQESGKESLQCQQRFSKISVC